MISEGPDGFLRIRMPLPDVYELAARVDRGDVERPDAAFVAAVHAAMAAVRSWGEDAASPYYVGDEVRTRLPGANIAQVAWVMVNEPPHR